jgi:hypothetical protein
MTTIGSGVTDSSGTVAISVVQGTSYTASFSGTGAPGSPQNFVGGSNQGHFLTSGGNTLTDDSSNRFVQTTGTTTTVPVAGFVLNYVRATQVMAEALASGDASAKVTQVSLEALTAGRAHVYATQIMLEALVKSVPPNVRVTQAVLKTLITRMSDVRVTQAVMKVLIDATPPQYTVQQFVYRVLNLLPKPWWSREGLQPGGIAYIYVYAIAAALSGHKGQLDYVKNQTRIRSASGANLDNIALDYLGPTFLRSGRSDTQFRAAILAAILAAKVTLLAMQTRLNDYYANTFETTYANRPTVTVWDKQSDPTDAATYDINPPEFVIEVSYPFPTGSGWVLGQSNLGRTTTLLNTVEYLPFNPEYFDPGLVAIVMDTKAEGTMPIYLGRIAYY